VRMELHSPQLCVKWGFPHRIKYLMNLRSNLVQQHWRRMKLACLSDRRITFSLFA
jgi:hypothetical protein